MRKNRKLTEAECEVLRRHPAVKLATPERFSLTFEFRISLYEYWSVHGQSSQAVRQFLSDNGFDVSIFRGTVIIPHLSEKQKKRGRPTRGKNTVPGEIKNFRSNEEDNAYLISTGRFIAAKRGKGITFAEPFVEELYRAYPEQSIEDGLKAAGIDPAMVGYRRIYTLKKMFDGIIPFKQEKKTYSEDEILKFSDNPYVKRITETQLSLNSAFYSDAHYLIEIMHINEILELFEIEPELLSISSRNNIRHKLKSWKGQKEHVFEVTPKNLRILRNVMKALDKSAESALHELSDQISSLSLPEKKRLCQYIDALGEDPGRKYTKRYILSLLGISKTAFYSCLSDSSYGTRGDIKNLQDEEDIKVIQTVIDYKGYPKGTRMIYMMMKKITGRQFSIKKIRRLKRKFGITCPVRKANVNRRAAQELLERNRKDNLLKRTFRLHRPHEVYLSDVTYLDFGENKRAYGSAILDSVTGKVICFEVSEHNDLQLVDNSLNWFKAEKSADGALFHTDQGSVYLSDSFQKRIKSLNLNQSMSKRGNCWDNSPQESFFGHFKDEVDYSKCRTVEELNILLYKYMQYYNNERCQWTRNRMTPVEYEKYLCAMSDEEFAAYMAAEEEKYRKMMEEAARKAKARVKTIGPE